MLTIEGNTVTNQGIFRKRIEINEGGIIETIGEPKGNADFVFKEELVFPGFIDLHVHAREDPSHADEYKEDFRTAGMAAIQGGVVACADMPNNPMPPIDDRSYAAKEVLARKSIVDVVLYAGIGPATEPLLRKVPYKVFMGKSVGDLFFDSLGDLDMAMKKYEGCYVSFHCEDPRILEERSGEPTHASRRPPEAEVAGIDAALALIVKYGIFGKICHVSTAEGARTIAEAKGKGVSVTAEVTPHHLYFDETMIEGNEKLFQVNPPIRQTAENRRALIEALRRGDIDYLATDHAPHTGEDKMKGVSGVPHLDTYGSFVSWLMEEHGFTPLDIARVCAYNPGNFLNQFVQEKFGVIEKGYAGSFTVLDVHAPHTIKKERLKTKCGWSPFEGMMFPGRAVATIVKGKVYENK